MVIRRRATKEGASPSGLLKWAAGHPPHDHVIIVFNEGDARDPHRLRMPPKTQEMAGGMP
jgi:hypothetical protein